MPELPEVETVARSLRPRIVGRTISAVWTSGLPLRRPVDRAGLRRACAGARVELVERRGKFLVLALSSGRALVCHLGMTGRLLVEPPGRPRAPHTHAVFALGAGADELRYVDPRRFGHLVALPTAALDDSDELGGLGVDPLSAAFTAAALRQALGGSTRAIKDALLDQRILAGVGNIYACEALFAAGISPRRQAGRLGPTRTAALHRAIAAVLEDAVARRGTSFSDYVDADGQSGENQHHLAVYGRQGAPCPRCQRPVRRIVQGGRSTFYCPRCQP